MMTQVATDDTEIPAFLKVTDEEQAKRREYNREHPVSHAPFMMKQAAPTVDEDERARREAEFLEDEKRRKYEKLHKAGMRKPASAENPKGDRWENGRWVRNDGMTTAKFATLLRDMPSDEHRAVLRKAFKHFAKVEPAPPLKFVPLVPVESAKVKVKVKRGKKR